MSATTVEVRASDHVAIWSLHSSAISENIGSTAACNIRLAATDAGLAPPHIGLIKTTCDGDNQDGVLVLP